MRRCGGVPACYCYVEVWRVEVMVTVHTVKRGGGLTLFWIKWGIPKELPWVDPDTRSLSYDKTKTNVISANVIDLELKIDFQDDWAEWVKGANWDTLAKDASAGLDWKRADFIKGKGKGDGKGNVHRAGNGKGPG